MKHHPHVLVFDDVTMVGVLAAVGLREIDQQFQQLVRLDPHRVVANDFVEVEFTATGSVGELVGFRVEPEAIAERRGSLLAYIDRTPVIFGDVATDAWYAPYVSYLIQENVAQGYKNDAGQPTGEFGVTNSITRAELLKMALEAAGKAPDPSDKLAPANKSARGSWAASYVREAEDMKLTVFLQNPDVNAPATRGEVVQTILEVMGIPVGAKVQSSYIDVLANHPYAPAITVATVYGLVEGDKNANGEPLNTFRPDDPINRAEASKIIALARQLLKK
jgi:hypothetical protein